MSKKPLAFRNIFYRRVETQMNKTKVYADNFFKVFAGEEDFLSFLKNRKEKTTWKKETSSNIRFEALVKDTPSTDALVDVYRNMDKGHILDDTMEGTQLILHAGDECIPVRNCAIKTILERARISGNALSKVERSVFAKILNYCLNVADGQALLKVSDDKVSAVHGGDRSDYSVLEMYELFKKTSDYLNDNFTDVKYVGGFYEHSIVTALWSLDGNDELIQTYKDLLAMHSVKCRELKASVRLTTSDVGISGANLYPTLIADGRNIPLGSPLKLEHKNGATVKDFEKKLTMLYSQYDLAIGKLKDLINVTVKNPGNTMIGVMSKIGIPKKYGIPALEKFNAVNGAGICTAHEIYYGISEVIFLMQCAGESGMRITQMEETVSRALNVKWQDYDIPGEVKW